MCVCLRSFLFTLPDKNSNQNLKMKRKDFCLNFLASFFGPWLRIIQSSFSIRKRWTTLACNFVDGNPGAKKLAKHSRQKYLRFILRFGSEFSSGLFVLIDSVSNGTKEGGKLRIVTSIGIK